MDVLDSLKEYGSSGSSDEEDPPLQSDAKLPALPPSFLSMFHNEAEEDYNNSSLHRGKQRSFPHVPGNWATYVYCRVQQNEELASLMSDLTECVPNHIQVELMEDLHVSLSRTVPLQFHWIQPFTDDLRQRITAKLGPFTCSFSGVKILTNDERTRSFLALTIAAGSQQLQAAVNVVDKCLEEYSLPTFYKDACFHTSFAWFLGDSKVVLAGDVYDQLQECFSRHQSSFPLLVDTIWCKSGCKQFSFKLTG